MNLYRNSNDQAISSVFSRYIVKKPAILLTKSRAIWPVSQDQIFPKHGIFAGI